MDIEDAIKLAWMRQAVTIGTAQSIRVVARISQAELARACGVTPEAISKWENGHRRPTGAPAIAYARALHELSRIAPE